MNGSQNLRQRCSSCLTLHSAHPAIGSLSHSRSYVNFTRHPRDVFAVTSFSRYTVFRREFRATRNDLDSARTNPNDDGDAPVKGEGLEDNNGENRLSLKE